MAFLTPKYPPGAEPPRKPSHRERRAADGKPPAWEVAAAAGKTAATAAGKTGKAVKAVVDKQRNR